ncbi:MAG: hypothetical protein U0Y68_00545 [Blastocatellia bacterium]
MNGRSVTLFVEQRGQHRRQRLPFHLLQIRRFLNNAVADQSGEADANSSNRLPIGNGFELLRHRARHFLGR